MTADPVLIPLSNRAPRVASADRMSVAIVGAGYVGLVTAACLAAIGHDVVCVDLDGVRIATLNAGRVPFYEPGLQDLIERAGPRLAFSTDLAEAVAGAAIVFVAVGTPARPDGRPDLGQLLKAVEDIGGCLAPEAVLVIKSTVPVGTGAMAEEIVRARSAHGRVSVASNPEFLREGSAIADLLHADRIVVGVADERAETALRRLYRPLTSGGRVPFLVTGRPDAELIKYASNGFLAMKIAYINEIADLCEKVGADIADVAHAVGLDGRIGPAFLQAGPGYGGSCFPKDTEALADIGRRNALRLSLVEATIGSNRARIAALAERVAAALGGSVEGRSLALLGLAFKANTDDVRESPAIALLRALLQRGAIVRPFDPKAHRTAGCLLPELALFDDPYAACRDADAAVIATDWQMFRSLDLKRLRALMAGDVLVDFRNQFDPAEAARHGFRYVSVGRRAAGPGAAAGARLPGAFEDAGQNTARLP